ncbi:MAG: bifunctional folylpolyglutamate synthase/dihydrofolate synthase [Clostridiales bacterium]|nr:bifunctional folylpolyglutamate synthase/dihydrofolate synthase [Clostridiales bacterium]
MNYNDALNYIHSLLRFGIKPGMERISALLERLGNPQNDLKFVHIGGTNGKGTVCTMVSEILQQAGYKTGLFTSPYVVDFRERIQIDGKMISEKELAEIVENVFKVVEKLKIEELQPTEFEVITAVAMLYFKKMNCDVVVLEVGLGGLLDSTNIISESLVSVITSVSKDHTKILGDTITEIAQQKCGIIKQDGYTAIYPLQTQEALNVINKTIKEKKNELFLFDTDKLKIEKEDINGSDIVANGLPLHISLIGHHQIYNTLTALSTVEALKKRGLNITDDNIQKGVAKANIPARLEKISISPLCILDGGHNIQGATALSDTIEKYIGTKVCAVMSMMEDKDYYDSLKLIAPHCQRLILTTASNPRAISAERLKELAKKFCKECVAVENPVEAVDLLIDENQGLPMVICGSLYLAGDVRKRLIEKLK